MNNQTSYNCNNELFRDAASRDLGENLRRFLASPAGLLTRHGGNRDHSGRGVWQDDERGGTLLKEEPIIVFSYVAEAGLTSNAISELYRTLSRMDRQANQGEIGVVIDGNYYGITEYVEE